MKDSPGAPRLSVPLVLFLSAFTAVFFLDQPAQSQPEWWTIHAMAKIQPWEKLTFEMAQPAQIAAGRNEFEPFQIILRAPDADVEVLDAAPSDLRGAKGTIDRRNVRIYSERYVSLKN